MSATEQERQQPEQRSSVKIEQTAKEPRVTVKVVAGDLHDLDELRSAAVELFKATVADVLAAWVAA